MIAQRVWLFVAGLVFLLHLALGAPGLTWYDGGELVLAGSVMGVSHPPGQPAYMVLAALAGLLPVGGFALRLSLLSALCAAASAALFAALVTHGVRRLPGASAQAALLAGAVAGLVLGLSPALTLQGVRPELYAPMLLLLLLAAWAAVRGGRRGVALAVVPLCVAGAMHHAMLVAAVPGLAFVVVRRLRWVPPAARVALVLLPLGLGQFLWLPLRSLAQTPFDFGVPRTAARILASATGAAYARSFHLVPGQLTANARAHLGVFAEDVGVVSLLLALFGAVALLKAGQVRVLCGGLLLCVLGSAPTALQGVFFAHNPDAHGYLLPPIAILAGAAGVGASALLDLLRRRGGPSSLVGAGMLLLAAATPLFQSVARADQRGLRSPHRLAVELLHQATPGALILLGGDSWLFPTLAVRYRECRRPDVSVLGLHMLDLAALPDLEARGVPVPAQLPPGAEDRVARAAPGLAPEAIAEGLLAQRSTVDVFVNDFFLPPDLLEAREPFGLLHRIRRGMGATPPPHAAEREAALSERLFDPLDFDPAFARDRVGAAVLSRRDATRGAFYLAQGDGALALRVLSRGSRVAPDPYAMVHLARHRLEIGLDRPGPTPEDAGARAAAEAMLAGRLDEARTGVEHVLATNPTHALGLLTAERLYSLGRSPDTGADAP